MKQAGRRQVPGDSSTVVGQVTAVKRPTARRNFDELPDVLNVSEVAELLGTSPSHVYEQVAQGKFEGTRLGKRVFVAKATIRRALGIDNTDGPSPQARLELARAARDLARLASQLERLAKEFETSQGGEQIEKDRLAL